MNFEPVVDVNTQNVWAWVAKDDEGNVVGNHDVDQSNWKPVSQWSDGEIAALFQTQVIEPLVLTTNFASEEDDED